MTAVSLINPYAPQPANGSSAVTAQPHQNAQQILAPSNGTSGAGLGSDHTGQGADKGTGTGGPQLATLLKRGRTGMLVQQATPESVFEALAMRGPATEFLERQALRKIEAKAMEEARQAERDASSAEEAKSKAEKAVLPEYVMPNPLPTAPILMREET